MQNLEDYLNSMSRAFQHRYVKKTDVWTQDAALRRGAELVLRQIPTGKIFRVLDIGAGRGADADGFLKRGHHYIALDLVQHAEWKELRRKWNERFEAKAIPFHLYQDAQPNGFDLIYDSGCFHHQHPDMFQVYLQKILSLLKADGLLALTVYTPRDPAKGGRTEIFEDGRFAHVFNQAQLKLLIEPFGFQMEFHQRIPHENGSNIYLFATFRRSK